MKKDFFKEQVKGITLIALVVTIIVLLILSSVAISLTIANNGIFTKAQQAVIIDENALILEQLQFKITDYELDNVSNKSDEEIINLLKRDQYVNEDNSVNVRKLVGKNTKTGNGSIATGDVYVLEPYQKVGEVVKTDSNIKIKTEYYLIYYDTNKNSKSIGKAFDTKEEEFLENTPESYFEYDDETSAIALKGASSFYHLNMSPVSLGLKTIVIPSKFEGKDVKKVGIMYPEGENSKYFKPGGINASDVERIVLPEGIEIIEERAFNECNKLKEINIPISVNSIGARAFEGCDIIESIKLPMTVKSIGGACFYGCKKLQDIELPNGLKQINYLMFGLCESLQSIEIPSSVTVIDNSAFYSCKSLESIEIPSNVAFMGPYVFTGCTSLKTIKVPFKEGEQPIGWDSNWNGGCSAKIIYEE